MTKLDLNEKFAARAAKESKSLLKKIERANTQLGRMLADLSEQQRQIECKHDWWNVVGVHRCLKCNAAIVEEIKK